MTNQNGNRELVARFFYPHSANPSTTKFRRVTIHRVENNRLYGLVTSELGNPFKAFHLSKTTGLSFHMDEIVTPKRATAKLKKIADKLREAADLLEEVNV